MMSIGDAPDGGRFRGSAFLSQSAALNRALMGGGQDSAALAERNRTGVDLLRQDRPVEAAETLYDAVVDCVEVLGPEHPDTIVAAGNLAVAHACAGRLAEALA